MLPHIEVDPWFWLTAWRAQDGPPDEMELSRHAVSLLDLVDEVRSYQSGAPVVPLRPGMLFLATPGTPMALACAHGESYGDPDFVRCSVDEVCAHEHLPPRIGTSTQVLVRAPACVRATRALSCSRPRDE
jgi:hypothetical protein